MTTVNVAIIEWFFTPLSTVFQSYHSDSSLKLVAPILIVINKMISMKNPVSMTSVNPQKESGKAPNLTSNWGLKSYMILTKLLIQHSSAGKVQDLRKGGQWFVPAKILFEDR